MGRRNRNFAPRSKSSVSPTAESDSGEREEVLAPLVESDVSYTSIKLECERAMKSLSIGSHTKALRIMKDLCSKHENSPYAAFIHRVRSTVYVKVSSLIDDPNVKYKHVKSAIEDARKATLLSPSSIEFAYFYASLLYDVANEANEYEEVVQECERALAIENPVDPRKESLQENQLKQSTPSGRIKHVREELGNLIQKTNIASLSTWMKHLGTGEEKFRVIPIRRLTEDWMELRPVQARRPNEIQKATKTLEERRKEIEVRVAATKLLMQKSELDHTQNGGDKGSGVPAVVGQKGCERRKNGNARKNASSVERMDRFHSYWNSMTLDMKKDLLRVRIPDLKNHFSSLKNSLASEVLSEALLFSEVNKTWKFWTCFYCDEKFADPELHIQHVRNEHIGQFSPNLQSVLPLNVNNVWASMLSNCSWIPLDIKAAATATLLEELSDPQGHGGGTYQRNMGDVHNGATVERRKYENVPDIECNGGTKKFFNPDRWPTSNDPERGKLLEKIRSAFRALIKHKYLASSHLLKVIQYAVEELKGIDEGSQLLNYNIDQTPLCICFLGAQELLKVLKFLQELALSCGISIYSERNNTIEDANIVTKVTDAMEKIVFSEDGSYLLFDGHFLPHKLSPGTLHDVVTDDKIAAVSSNIPYDNGVPFDPNTFLSWICMGPSSGEQLECWLQLREEKAQQGTEIVRLLEKEFHDIQGLCEKKCQLLSFERAVNALAELCLKEGKKKEHATDFVCQTRDVVLKKRQEELMENHCGVENVSSMIEVEAISNILNEAQSLHVSQAGYGDACNGETSHLCDLEWGEADDWKWKDSCVDFAIQRRQEGYSVELCKIDARILQILSRMQQLELKLEPISANDYRRVLVPLVKSFLRAYLEDLAEKYATEKSDAAREAFLAELARDSKRSSAVGIDNPKNATERTREKKKIKDHRKNKDSKASSRTVLPLDNHETSEDSSFQVSNDGENQEDELVISGSQDSLSQEDQKFKIELKEEEKVHEEKLEYQRGTENEAEFEHLDDQPEKVVTTLPEKMPTELIPDACLSNEEDQDTVEQWKSNGKAICVPNCLEKNECPGILDGLQKTTADVDATRTEIRNGGMPEGDTSISDQWAGKKSRRQKGLAKSNKGKNPLVTSGREKNKVDEPTTSYHLQEKMSSEMGDFGVSTSEIAAGNVPGINVYGAGLQNEIGEYNCFLNVIIQSLWNIRRFRDEFLRSSSEHTHVGDPCVTCALYDVFTALSIATSETRIEAVAPTSLRIALSNLYPGSNFFQEGQMNDASEVLGVIFDCLHRSFASALGASGMKSTDRCTVSWDCTNTACVVHSIFGMNVFERMNCPACKLDSRPLKYTTFFHNINANALRTMKVKNKNSSFDELINLIERSHLLACDPDVNGCGKLNYIHQSLCTPPHVFTIVLGWQNTCESLDNIKATLAALSTEIDISVPYHGLEPNNKYRLVSVVCYYRQHYHCVTYSREHEKWIVYNDQTVKEIGSSWDDVLTMCIKGHLQPQVLFFEASN